MAPLREAPEVGLAYRHKANRFLAPFNVWTLGLVGSLEHTTDHSDPQPRIGCYLGCGPGL